VLDSKAYILGNFVDMIQDKKQVEKRNMNARDTNLYGRVGAVKKRGGPSSRINKLCRREGAARTPL